MSKRNYVNFSILRFNKEKDVLIIFMTRTHLFCCCFVVVPFIPLHPPAIPQIHLQKQNRQIHVFKLHKQLEKMNDV